MRRQIGNSKSQNRSEATLPYRQTTASLLIYSSLFGSHRLDAVTSTGLVQQLELTAESNGQQLEYHRQSQRLALHGE